MVKDLAKGHINVNGASIRLEPALAFPSWLEENHPDLEDDYSRVAVFLGGRRKRLIQQGEASPITAGDVVEPPKLEGYYQRGA